MSNIRKDRVRDDKLREEVGIYEHLMDDISDLVDMLIGNDTLLDYTDAGEYIPFVEMVAQFHFDPDNQRLYKDLMRRIKMIEKNLLKFRERVEQNHSKGRFIALRE